MKDTRIRILPKLQTRLSAASLAVISLVMMIVLSGCMGGRGGIRHHYNSAYGDGVVYYEGYEGYHGHHDNGWHGYKPKKVKYKKHKKHHKHKHHHHDDD